MANIVFAAPYVPPFPDGGVWAGVPMTWTGWDGSVWELTDPDSGVCITTGGVEGLSMPSFTHYTQSSPAVAGQWYRGSVADARRVFWPLLVWHDHGSREWVLRDRAFWRTMDPARPGVWSVVGPDGSRRTLTCRFEDDGTQSFHVDPVQAGWAVYGVSLTADQPFWAGEPVSRAWAPASPKDFFNGGAAPVFNISSASTLATATMSNPGDVDAWPVWTIAGDATGASSASVGVGDAQVVVPFDVPAGKALVVDTDPAVQTALFGDWDGHELTGVVDRTADLGAAVFAPVPAGMDRPVNINLVGSGKITATLTPLYRRAW